MCDVGHDFIPLSNRGAIGACSCFTNASLSCQTSNKYVNCLPATWLNIKYNSYIKTRPLSQSKHATKELYNCNNDTHDSMMCIFCAIN